MANRPPYPREARIVALKKGPIGSVNTFIWYQLRSDYPHPNTLISEHKTENEAKNAKEQYENENKK
ncbi:YaiA family protein [Pantoea sp. Aalb]|uniref:YaiA family protein n=1 Tax=Pantoea sp. Aalb TaxID=2576762 RepID=UPI0013239CF9|nr:YaiA family protein [Pantoea sp. Aalb]MXP67596.1 hypothetical protein [Pantoea sp. Aalb]